MNTEPKQPNIEHITAALEDLRLCHHQLGEAIRKLSLEVSTIERRQHRDSAIPKSRRTIEVKPSREDCENAIGSYVRIVNPGKGEPDVGYIHSVGKLYVTVVISGGTRKQRIPKNLRLIQHE